MSGPRASTRAPARRRSKRRAFTLVELLISLVAGLIVAIAVVGLSKEATNTFYEESRAASAEMSVRTAIDRIRADVQRAAFMSSPAIQRDPTVPLNQLGSKPTIGAAPLVEMTGLRLFDQGSKAKTPLSAINGFTPDALQITGNLTTSDQYVVRTATSKGASCGGPLFELQLDSAAMYRASTGANTDAVLQNIFQPVAGRSFMVRIADDLGRAEYHLGCAKQTAGVSNGVPYVELASGESFDPTPYGMVDGRLTVNPVTTVRWELMPLPAEAYPQYAALDTEPNKYNLVRSWVDATGVIVTPPELVAEHAVDLKFAFTADLTDYTLTPGSSGWSQTVVTYAFGDANNASIAGAVTSAGSAARPQRIRNVRVRLSTRSPIADRSLPLSLPDAGSAYPLRYCTNLEAGVCNVSPSVTTREWARLRTITTEVSLPNQARAFY